MVPLTSILGIVFTLAVCIGMPVWGMRRLRELKDADGAERYPRLWRPFLVGLACFVVAQLLTRLPLNALVVPRLPPDVSGLLLSGPVASLTAGLFEETARLIFMLLLLKAFHRWADGVAFGLGHGGIEAITLVGFTMLNNLLIAMMINRGEWERIAASIPPELQAQVRDALVTTPSLNFFLAGVERIGAVSLHIALSLLIMWGIVRGKRLLAWVLAVALHALTNTIVVLMATSGVQPVLVQVVMVAVAVASWVWILRSRPLFPTAIEESAT